MFEFKGTSWWNLFWNFLFFCNKLSVYRYPKRGGSFYLLLGKEHLIEFSSAKFTPFSHRKELGDIMLSEFIRKFR